MPWNYRVTRQQYGDQGEGPTYDIREVYYGPSGNVYAWSERGLGPWSDDSVADLKNDHALMAAAFDRPVLDITDEDNPVEVTDATQ